MAGAVRLRRRARDDRDGRPGGVARASGGRAVSDRSPARVVADADVLAADLLVGGASRAALDYLRRHSWTALVASDPLLDDAEATVAALADDGLAADWRARVESWRDPVDHPAGDHPALASALHGGAMHVLSLDDRLTAPDGVVSVRDRVETSVREPAAFARLFDPEALYEAVVGGTYPGPDRDPRE
ncbi:MAG: hypothetical protein ABEJ34_08355 [Haloferacaceae archaeon]